jgi:hypothetical protein
LGRAGHTEVWEALAGLGGVKWWMTAYHAQNLRRQRNNADYGERIGGLSDADKKAIKVADQIIREISGIDRG